MVKVYTRNGSTSYNICNYLLSTVSELQLCDPLCADGSIAFIIETSELYIKENGEFKNIVDFLFML